MKGITCTSFATKEHAIFIFTFQIQYTTKFSQCGTEWQSMQEQGRDLSYCKYSLKNYVFNMVSLLHYCFWWVHDPTQRKSSLDLCRQARLHVGVILASHPGNAGEGKVAWYTRFAHGWLILVKVQSISFAFKRTILRIGTCEKRCASKISNVTHTPFRSCANMQNYTFKRKWNWLYCKSVRKFMLVT